MFEQILETTRQVAHATSQAIAATIRNIREIAVQVPQYVMRAIRAVPDALSVGLEAGLALGRFFLTHIPEMFRFFGRCLRFIGNLIFEIIRDFPRFIRACFELMGTILRNFSHIMRISFEFVKWMTRATVNALISLARNIVNVTSTALGIAIGIVVAPFQLIYEAIFPNRAQATTSSTAQARTKEQAQTQTQENELQKDPELAANYRRRRSTSTEPHVDTQDNNYVPSAKLS